MDADAEPVILALSVAMTLTNQSLNSGAAIFPCKKQGRTPIPRPTQISMGAAVMHNKVVGRPWPPGRSGNPGGRPKAALDIQALARQHTPDAIAALVAALANPRDRGQPAAALLDRGRAKPIQVIEMAEWSDLRPARTSTGRKR